MRPLTLTCPLVGAVTRERILSSVLLPAPLRPMMPSTSPCSHREADILAAPRCVSPSRLPWSVLPDLEQRVGLAAQPRPPDVQVIGQGAGADLAQAVGFGEVFDGNDSIGFIVVIPTKINLEYRAIAFSRFL